MNKIVLLIISFIFSSCVAQKERIENEIMECSYQSYSDNGKQLKQLISDYQQLLIDEKILTDRSGKSYRNILQDIADRNELNKAPSKFFLAELKKIDKPDSIKIQDCQKIIVNDSALYNLSKLKRLEQVIIDAQDSNDLRSSLIAKNILEVLSEDDFELEFYKLRVFFILESISSNNLLQLPSKLDIKENDLKDALKIYLDGKNQIFVNEKKVNVSELKKQIRDYESVNKSKSVISIKVEQETAYKTYVDVQNVIAEEINFLREQLAKEKYSNELDKLTEEQLAEIKKIYPQKIVE